MGVLRGTLTSKRRWWRKMNNNEKLTTSGVLMSGFFEGLPLHCCLTLPEHCCRIYLTINSIMLEASFVMSEGQF